MMVLIIDVMPAKVYKGWRDGAIVHVAVNGIPLIHIPYHSPDGFEWGYGGSGPADLSLSMLADYFEEQDELLDFLAKRQLQTSTRCWKLYPAFKSDVVASFPKDRWTLPSAAIDYWVARYRS